MYTMSHAIPARSTRESELMSRVFPHRLLNSTCPCRTPTASPPVRSLLYSKSLGKVWAGVVSFLDCYVIDVVCSVQSMELQR